MAHDRDEHYACGSHECAENQWHAMFTSLVETVQEEADHLRKLVDDDDSSCPAHALRRERLAALEWVLSLGDTLTRWEW